jgi:short-subunit dehydrogenase
MPMWARWQAKDSIAIVTGASSGIGREICKLLIARGATIIASARRVERLESLREQCQPSDRERLHILAGDIVEIAVREQLVERAKGLGGGRLDLLVNNAGIGALGPFADASPERLRRIMEVNFFAPVELARLAFPLLCRGRNAVMCNISSVLGHRAVPDKSEYCASKFALHGWSDAVRAEWKPFGIQVTLISPSTTQSEFFDSVIETDPAQRSHSFGSWAADKVARASLATITARRSEAILSLGGKALVYADRLTPPMINFLLAKKR